MSQAPMPRPTNPVMAPQMPVQGPMPYGMPNRNPLQQFAANQSAAGNPIQTTATMGPNGMVQQQPLSQDVQQLYKAFLDASQGRLPMGSQQAPQQAAPMPFAAGDPRYVNALPYMGPPVTGPAPDMSKQFGPLMGGPFNGTTIRQLGPQSTMPFNGTMMDDFGIDNPGVNHNTSERRHVCIHRRMFC